MHGIVQYTAFLFESAEFQHLFLFPQPKMNNPYITNSTEDQWDVVHFYPQGHLKFDSGAGPGVLKRKALSQRHVLLRQQAAQRHRQITQGAFMLVIFHLCMNKEGLLLRHVSYLHHLVHDHIKNRCYHLKWVVTSTSSSCLLGLWTRNEKESSHRGSLVLYRIFMDRYIVICQLVIKIHWREAN